MDDDEEQIENNVKNMFRDVEEIRPDGEQPLHFYYNREERIAKAPPKVQEYYRGGMRPVRGFKVLWLKQNRFIFLSLIFLVAVALIYSGINRTRDSATISDINFEMSANRFKDEIYVRVSMKRSSKTKDNYPVPLVANFFAINSDNQIQDKQEMVWTYNEGEEFLETKFTDYDIMRVDISIKIGDEEKEISSVVKG